MNDARAIALVTCSALLPTVFKALKSVPKISKERVFIIDGETHKSQKTIEELIQQGKRSSKPLPPLTLKKDENKTKLAFICYSSGTTGLPKGVMISHYNVISNILQVELLERHFNAHKRDITILLLPLYHIYGILTPFPQLSLLSIGLSYAMHADLYIGNTCVIVPAFEFSSFLRYIEKYKMTKLYLVPPVIVRLVKDSLTENYNLSSLQQIISGAAPLGSDTMALLRIKFKNIIFKQCTTSPHYLEIQHADRHL